jgi:predicted nucleic acid-binding protein
VFVAGEAGRPIGELPGEIAVSAITVGELELGVLRARDGEARARRLATLSQVRGTFFVLPVDDLTASCFARLAAESTGRRKLRRHDTWIAATALRHGVAVVTQDADFAAFSSVPVIRV